MYAQHLDEIRPGTVLAQTVHDEDGQPLLMAGTPLTGDYLDRLRRRGVLAVHVQDGLADDVAPTDVVSEQLRQAVTGNLATVFANVATIASERGLAEGGVPATCDALGEEPLKMDATAVDRLYADVEALIAEILQSGTIEGLESLKTHNEYTFQHSVDVAIIGALVGRRLGLPQPRLRELALGCLLHDLGKTYVDQAILDKGGPLTAEEFAAVKEHPRMGFELVRRMPVDSILPAHVAYQHHERQNGSGYPRGLVGRNRIGPRLAREEIGAKQMLLIAEIGAAADVYSALSSDRPYRVALAPDAVTETLDRLAGGHLNREIVRTMRELVPAYPVGHWVEIVTGRWSGWRGVVAAVRPGSDQPIVRLLIDDRGEPVADPSELDTREEEDLRLRCLSRGETPASAPDGRPLGEAADALTRAG